MSLTGTFNTSHTGLSPADQATERGKRRRLPPFSLRLTEAERARLIREAGGAPLGAYIKAKALGDPPLRMRRTGLAVEDRQALAQALALLGSSRIASNLNQLAHAANIGTLPITPETEADLREALRDVRGLRYLLLLALGFKPEAAP